MASVADGDAAALGVLYDRYAGGLTALARRVLGSQADAEEVLQEVFVHAWRQARRYDPTRASVATWLSLITRSRAIDRVRSRRVAQRAADGAWQDNPVEHESPTAAGSVLHHERRQRVTAALRELPPEQRQVIELAYYKGLSQSEIATEQGLPLGTVKTRTLLAMKKLRLALGADIEELL